MGMTETELWERFNALSSIATSWGVAPSTLAQYVDCAGSYSTYTAKDTGVPRKLPPRASIEGIMLASTVTSTVGTPNMRNVVVAAKLIRSRQEEQLSDLATAISSDTDGAAS